MTDSDVLEPLSNTSDSSFIFLESVCPGNENGTSGPTVLFETNNRNTSSRSFNGQCFMEGNIEDKLKQLVQENYQLRETLSQNNLAIKSQLDTFYMWQQEVLKTHETHKEKFLETKDLILKLRAENLSLKKQLGEAFSIIGDDDSFALASKNQGSDLKEETDQFKSMNVTEENKILEMENLKLIEKLQSAENEVLKLHNELENVVRENKFLKQKNTGGSLPHGSLPNSEARALISNLFKQLEMERNRVSELKEKLKMANDIISKVQNSSLAEEVNEFKRNLDDMNLSLDRQNQRYSSLQSWVTLTQENIKEDNLPNGNHNLLGEIKQLKSHFSQEEKTCKKKQENLQELKNDFQRLLENYKTLQLQYSSIQIEHLKIEKYKNESESLSQQLEQKNKEFLAKQQECDILKEEIKKLNLECEEVAILKAQMQVYQDDFNEERAAREALVEEKENMAEKIRHLESQLESLQKVNTEEKQETETEESFLVPYKGNKNNYICPQCCFSFRDRESCTKHIRDCLNIHFHP